MPNDVIALTTQPRSSRAIWRREDASFESDEGVEDAVEVADADALAEIDERVEDGEVVTQEGIVAAPGGSGVGVPASLTELTSTSSSLGRESASATTLAFP